MNVFLRLRIEFRIKISGYKDWDFGLFLLVKQRVFPPIYVRLNPLESVVIVLHGLLLTRRVML